MATPITLSTDGRDPWDRQPRETEKQHGYFRHYLEAGRTRALKKTAEACGLTHRTVQEYAYRNRWTDRITAWETHRRAQFDAIVQEAQQQMVRKHLRVSNAVYDKAWQAVEGLDPTILTATETVRLLDAFSKLQRFALGEPDQTVAVQGGRGAPVEITSVPVDEAERTAQLRQAMDELARRVGMGESLDALLEDTPIPD